MAIATAAINFLKGNIFFRIKNPEAQLDGIIYPDQRGIYVGGAISGSDLPGSSNSYTGGTQDAFIIGFNATTYGINWSKYLGGNNRDGAFDLVYVKPYVYLTGYTNSTASTFPETDLTGSLDYFDGTFNNTGSLYDIFIARFDASSGGMDWCTYYGGSSDESGTSICAGSDENYQDVIFITGRTSSLNFPFPTSNLPNAYDDQSINFGDTRTYLLMFDKNLTNKWVTLFGANNDIGTGVSTFSNQKLYLGGYTTSASAFPFDDGTNVPYGSAIPYYWDTYQGVDGFITRFDLSSVLVGINEIATSEGNFEVFPNPSNGAFEVRSNMLVGYDNFTICDILGRKLFEKEICEIHNNSIPVELLNFEKGLYLLRINSNVSSETIKIVIQ